VKGFAVVAFGAGYVLAVDVAAEEFVFVFARTVLAHFLVRVVFALAVVGGFVEVFAVIAFRSVFVFAGDVAAGQVFGVFTSTVQAHF
jgi:hypothetical protein